MIAPLASMVRSAGIAYIVVQVITWHPFYTADWLRLAPPALAVAWAAAVLWCLRRRRPSPLLACADSVVYVALALGAQGCVPPQVRDDMFSWLVISMSGQLLVPAWYAPSAISWLLTLAAPVAYWVGATLQPVTDRRTMTGATIILIIVGLAHTFARRNLYRRAAAADDAVDQAGHAASEQYVVLTTSIERREHERLLHDTVLNTLTALARVGADDAAQAQRRCRQDVALIEDALGEPDDAAAATRRPYGDLVSAVQTVAAVMRGRGLTVHVDIEEDGGPTFPPRVTSAISNATREALSNVAAHAGTAEAWVLVRLLAQPDDPEVPCRLQVTVRDQGSGFDRDRVDTERLGLRRSIAERAADCGGRATVWSTPGQGTVVTLSWPASSWPASSLPGLALADRGPGRETPSW